MIICCSSSFKTSRKTAVALGSFDGLHLGHIELIKRTISIAVNNNLVPVVYIVEKSQKKIVSNVRRMRILFRLGVGVVIIDQLSQDLVGVTEDDFASAFICGTFNAKYVVVGENYKFGPSGASGVEELKCLCKNNGVTVDVMPLLKVDGRIVSSSWIRELLASGMREEAEKFLIEKISSS